MNVQTSTSKLIKGATGDWEVVIGMEVHCPGQREGEAVFGRRTAFGESRIRTSRSSTPQCPACCR